LPALRSLILTIINQPLTLWDLSWPWPN